ncbi:MAG TPA: Hsp20/alpha crystallin family protein [Anaerolineaceae bacterium]|nr:Hsp20/alpha crystallin family protein [Anaerolineaceae bacterium]
MSNLSRWDPVRDMLSLRRTMDRLLGGETFDEEFNRSLNWNLPLDVSENQEEYIVKASLPGVNPDDLDISVDGNTLTIRAEVKADEEKKGETYHLRERRYGVFSRSITLPSTVKADAIEASYDNGVLTLKLPKTEEVKPRKIQIGSGQGKKQVIEGNSRS